MAIFNPEPQDINPNEYLKYSKSIQQPESDKSAGIALTAVGSTLESVVSLTDSTIKSGIDDKVRKFAEGERDDYAASLTNVRAAQTGQTPLNLLAGTPQDGTGSAPIPTSINSSLDALTRLQGAADSQKISETAYYGRQAAIMKGLRAQYPGYADYIDQRASAILGVNPANAYVRSIIEDINRGGDNQKSIQKETESALMEEAKKGNQLAIPILTGFRAGTVTANQAAGEIAQWNSLKYKLETNTAIRAANQGSATDQKSAAQVELSNTASQYVALHWSAIKMASGTSTPEGLDSYLRTHAADGTITDEKARSDGTYLKAQRDQIFADLWKQANTGGANSLMSKMGGDTEAVKKILNDQLAVQDLAITAVFNKDYGSAFSHQNFNEAIGSDTNYQLYNAPNLAVRQYMRNAGAINKIGGPQFAAQYFKDALVSDVPAQYREFTKTQQMGLLVQPDENQGKLVTLNSLITDAKAKGITSPKVYDKYVQTVNYLTSKDTPDGIKISLAKGFFDPQNRGALNNFQPDGTDPRGRPIPGQISVYNRLTSPEVTQEMARLGKKDPQMWQNYKNWAEGEFGNSIFRAELSNLRSVQATAETDNFHVHYDDTNNRFELRGADDGPLAEPTKSGTMFLQKSINRINSGLNTLKRVEEAGGGDTRAYLLDTMKKFGYAPQDVKQDTNAPRPYKPTTLDFAEKAFAAVSNISFVDRFNQFKAMSRDTYNGNR